MSAMARAVFPSGLLPDAYSPPPAPILSLRSAKHFKYILSPCNCRHLGGENENSIPDALDFLSVIPYSHCGKRENVSKQSSRLSLFDLS